MCLRVSEKRISALRFENQPVTPPKEIACSKRAWDGQVRKWRRLLHAWDSGGAHSSETPVQKRETAVAINDMGQLLEGTSVTDRAPTSSSLLPTPVFAPSAPAAARKAAPTRAAVSSTACAAVAAPSAAASSFHFTAAHKIAAGVSWADVTDDDEEAGTAGHLPSTSANVAAPSSASKPAAASAPAATTPAAHGEDQLSSLLDDAEADVDRAMQQQQQSDAPASTDELLDYEEDDADEELRAAALAAAQEL